MATRRAYFDAAMEVLADRGFSGLTIAALCSTVGVTSGSFYHHFGGWDGFVEALMRDWEQRETTELIAGIRGTEDDVRRRLDLIVEVALTVPRAAEAAIRSWSNNDATVAATQRRVDRARLAFIEEVLADLPPTGITPRDLATLVVATFIGLEQLGDEVDDRTFATTLAALRDRIIGVAEPQADPTPQ